MASLLIVMALPVSVFAVDTESPGDVSNLEAVSLDGAVNLTWDATTDNVDVAGYQVHYGTSSVGGDGQTYDDFVDVGDTLTHVVSGLNNGTKYYFSIVAYDDAQNESLNWAREANATPDENAGGVSDNEAPQVADINALNKEEVEIVFSEAVVLPSEGPENAFSIENDDTLQALLVLDAVIDPEDPTKKTVILTTEDQEEGASYTLLNVSTDVEDFAGNPVASGTTDMGVFTGSGDEKAVGDTDGPEVVSVEAVDNTHVLVTFDEAIVVSIDPSEDFSILEEEDGTKTLNVLGVDLGTNDAGVEDAAAVVTTTAQEAVSYMVVVSNVTDESGNTVNPARGAGMFMGMTGPTPPDGEVDNEAPLDVAKFLASAVLEADKYLVTLTWEVPSSNEGDTNEQVIYQSGDGEDFAKKATLGPDLNEYQVEGLDAGEYWFKITQKDRAGNESEGVVKKIVLSETGPEMLGLLFVSLGLGRIFGRKK